MKMTCKVLLILLLTSGMQTTRTQEPALQTAFPIEVAETEEDAVRLQILDESYLPDSFETLLFSLKQPLTLKTASEVKATHTIGQSLKLTPSLELVPEAIHELVKEACFRVPYSGWMQNAETLADAVAKEWKDLQDSEETQESSRRRTVRTQFYDFTILIDNFKKAGEPTRLTIYNQTGNYENLRPKVLKEIKSKLVLPTLRFPRPVAGAKKPVFSSWLAQSTQSPRLPSRIEKSENRWPILIQLNLATLPREWSTIKGSRRTEAPAGFLKLHFQSQCNLILGSLGEFAPSKKIGIPSQNGNTPIVTDDLQIIVSRKQEDGFDRYELKFRFAPEAAAKFSTE